MVYILFLLTGMFCLYFIVLFFQSSNVEESQTVIDFSDASSETLDRQNTTGDQAPLTTEKRITNIEKEIQKFERQVQSDDIPIAKALSAKLLQYYNVEIMESRDVFGFYVFGDLPVTTYSIDTARIYAFADPYYLIQKNMYVLDAFFEFNETDTFFGSSFFLNAKDPDGVVRFIFEYEGSVYGVEVLQTEYEELKKILIS